MQPDSGTRLAGQIRAMRAGGMSAEAVRRALGLSARHAGALGLLGPAAVPDPGARPAARPRAPAGPTMAAVLQILSEESGVSRAALVGLSQARALARLRHLLMWLLRERCAGASLPAIGHFLGRDHSSVLYGCRRCRRRLAEDPALAALAAAVEARLSERADG
ncbi:MAG TPA: helix-turn-helix domain-containing protein [Kiloniellales bacterium]|nr:helix-turn-helix domain-containing protein [Kiloniellales bacterium]